MINQETLSQIQQIPLTERIQIIELLLHSVKNELKQSVITQKIATPQFKVRQFNLGTDITLNREELYADRNHHVCD